MAGLNSGFLSEFERNYPSSGCLYLFDSKEKLFKALDENLEKLM
jgi:hypothetical protein